MGFLERMLGNLMGGKFGSHHGGYRGGHHSGYPEYPQGSTPGGGGGIRCPKCGSANADAARFCQQCGTSLSAGKCSGCGAEVSAGSKFCGQCGQART